MVDRKTVAMRIFIDDIARNIWGWNGKEDHCRTCNEKVGQFRDELSEEGFDIYGMCQKCQDRVLQHYFTPFQEEEE